MQHLGELHRTEKAGAVRMSVKGKPGEGNQNTNPQEINRQPRRLVKSDF